MENLIIIKIDEEDWGKNGFYFEIIDYVIKLLDDKRISIVLCCQNNDITVLSNSILNNFFKYIKYQNNNDFITLKNKNYKFIDVKCLSNFGFRKNLDLSKLQMSEHLKTKLHNFLNNYESKFGKIPYFDKTTMLQDKLEFFNDRVLGLSDNIICH